MKQNETRSELQQRIDSELREKLSSTNQDDEYKQPGSSYLSGTQQTSGLAWLWALILGATLLIIALYVAYTLPRN